MKVSQINLHHSIDASAEFNRKFLNNHFHIGLVQEPWINKNTVQGIKNKYNKVIYNINSQRPRAAIVIDKNIECITIQDFLTDDCVAVLTKITTGSTIQYLVIASIYFPGEENIPNHNLNRLLEFCKDKSLIIGCDANAHHNVWGSTDINERGSALLELIVENNLSFANVGDRPTLDNGRRQEVLDLTITNPTARNLVHK